MTNIVWRTLDRGAEIDIGHRQLPHWDQTGALTFVTFRLADSMPTSIIQQWIAEQQQWWWEQNAIQCDSIENVCGSGGLHENLTNQFRKFRLQHWQESLDDCHGSCVLRGTDLADIVGDALRFFDGERYDLERFVVMPNHVHLLVQMRRGTALRKQCENWLRYTARKINGRIGARGEFWQSEPFDHVVRSEKQFLYLKKYIAENPLKAQLKEGEYLLWERS